jgi:hypothetical protein
MYEASTNLNLGLPPFKRRNSYQNGINRFDHKTFPGFQDGHSLLPQIPLQMPQVETNIH